MSAVLTSASCYTSNGFAALQACCATASGSYTNQTFAQFNASHPTIVAATAGTNESIDGPIVGGCTSSAAMTLNECLVAAKAEGIHGVCDYTYRESRSAAERRVGTVVWMVILGLVAGTLVAL